MRLGITSLFFFNDTATTEIYTLSLHDALPICGRPSRGQHHGQQADREHPALRDVPVAVEPHGGGGHGGRAGGAHPHAVDRKSTRLNSSHANISYAVFCLKKKKKQN